MKKTIMIALMVAFMAVTAQGLMAQEVIWYVGSDYNSCSTYFTVGLHAEDVVITQTRVNDFLVPLLPEEDYITFTRTEHFYQGSPCPNWRYIYRIYSVDSNGVRTLATNKVYIIEAGDNMAPGVACASNNCDEIRDK